MLEYTIIAGIATAAVAILEAAFLKTGLFKTRQFWLTMTIVTFFQCLVDGWLTKRPNLIVSYNPHFMLGLRFPFSIPIEDWLFGFTLISLSLLLWSDLPRKNGQN